ncbi:MAG: bifunctional enoyl-CoA hydratase/phosphate acetyltransferase [Bacteroidales bacterium]|nr:bifunctional enoyl-CoA hydratase/phosphate acetyltransferase [Bacteroidales bacterium]MCF8457416.1 bifunctional enoyl-CoA hydratase/phosphate acetyltransferase [Bacteroidales bacterium]
MEIRKLNQMFEVLKSKDKKRLVAAYANDAHTIEAVNEAVDRGLIEATLVGDIETIKKVCIELNIDVSKFRLVQEANDGKAAEKAVELINNGEGDILMKGLVNTEKYMKAILNKEKGLMPPRAILSHVTCMENPNYHKLLIYGDVAVLPSPELHEKVAILNYLVQTAHALGIEKPKVAVISASENVSPKIPSSVDAAILSKMADRGQIKGAIVEGPLALDLAIDKESAEIKKMNNPVAGNADCLLFPNIETGNVFYKTNTKLAKAELGAVVAGAKVPCILSSRGDSVMTKLYSIALGALIANIGN